MRLIGNAVSDVDCFTAGLLRSNRLLNFERGLKGHENPPLHLESDARLRPKNLWMGMMTSRRMKYITSGGYRLSTKFALPAIGAV